ncbi:MAG: hypothetical protein P8X74_04010 [Reinekea sp.]
MRIYTAITDISICFSKIAGAPIGSPQFLGSKEESMACALRRYGVTDSGDSSLRRGTVHANLYGETADVQLTINNIQNKYQRYSETFIL